MDRAASRRSFALGLASAALAIAFAAPAAGAAPSLSDASAVTPEPAASSSEAPAPAAMALEFTRGTATVAGPGALVNVRCTGTVARDCVGTLSIEAPGEPPEVPFSIDGGSERVVVVPLGAQRSIFDGLVSVKSRVVAQTAQTSGESLRTARVLRFR